MESKAKASKSKSKLLFPIALVIVILLVGGGIFLSMQKNQKQVSTPVSESQQVKTLKSEDIGLSLSARRDGKAVIMKVAKLAGISSIEYEVSYDAEVMDEGQKNRVPRGVTNSPIQVKPSDSELTREVELGTCSRNVCKYDKVVSDVKFVIKVNYSNGTVGSVEQSVSL